MTTRNSKQNNVWPLPKFNFQVKFASNSVSILFQEVSGLENEFNTIEFRNNNSKLFSTVKMPGIVKYGNVTLKKGIFKKNNTFWDWYNKIKMNTIKLENVIIQLLDENGNPRMTWTLENAWPTKISGTDLKSSGNEVAVETIELAHEGSTISNG